jgi:hypothetical protein
MVCSCNSKNPKYDGKKSILNSLTRKKRFLKFQKRKDLFSFSLIEVVKMNLDCERGNKKIISFFFLLSL